MDLCNQSVIRDLLDRYGLAPKKGYGQNFLTNAAIPARIAECSAFGNNTFSISDAVSENGAFEIGPGLGCLTQELAMRYSKVVAVEIDDGLIPLLGETLADFDNITVIHNDFMKLNLSEFLKEQFGDKKVDVSANLPYYITSPVIMALLESTLENKPQIRKITTMIQLEVADRICATPKSSDYGGITAVVNLFGKARKLFNVSKGNFTPVPKVDSAVIEIELNENGVLDSFKGYIDGEANINNIYKGVSGLIQLAFEQRRKTLMNALSNRYPKPLLEKAFNKCSIPLDIRGEKLSSDDYVKLYFAIQSEK